MKITQLELEGAKIIEPTYFDDNRGYSAETHNEKTLSENGITTKFILDYQCLNLSKGTLRGIHFQNNPHPQAKLVRVLVGEIYDVIVDLRKNSPTYKQWIGHIISAQNRKQIYIPSGYGHAFLTNADNTVVLYKFDDYYNRDLVRAIRWNDPDIAIEWNVNNPVISQNDISAPFLKNSDVNLSMELNQ